MGAVVWSRSVEAAAFEGPQWDATNVLTGGAAPLSSRGFVDAAPVAGCGATRMSRPALGVELAYRRLKGELGLDHCESSAEEGSNEAVLLAGEVETHVRVAGHGECLSE